uniref:Uncharacterized protein n=1 Tax=Tetranychus urticae TaxID=32264 RepID=T1K1B7_TETUR
MFIILNSTLAHENHRVFTFHSANHILTK